MRRSVFGLSLVTAAAGLLLLTSCAQQDDVLRVVSINGGFPIYSDIADWAVWNDPTIPDSEEMPFDYMMAIPTDTCAVELQYVEIGAGLPTWTPFHADINKYTIRYESMDGATVYDDLIIPMTLQVPVDREGKKTMPATIVIADGFWKAKHFSDAIGGEPNEIEETFFDVKARIEFEAIDSVSGRTIKATGDACLKIADYYDDPERFGQ